MGYNVYNKTLSSMLAYPYTIATLSMGAGLMYFIPLWMLGIRKAPVLDAIDVKKIAGLATLHSVGHVATVIAMAAGAVSFTHIIKALEPLFSVIFGFIINRKTDPISVNIWLLPIIGGVAWSAVGSQIASGQNIIADINPIAFAGAMGSNVCFSLRGLLSKQVKAEAKSENLTSENLYALITLMSFFLILPFTAILEGDILAANWPPTQKCALADIPAAILGVPTFFKSDSLCERPRPWSHSTARPHPSFFLHTGFEQHHFTPSLPPPFSHCFCLHCCHECPPSRARAPLNAPHTHTV